MNSFLKVAAVVAVITVGGLAVSRVGSGPGPIAGAPGVEAPSVTEEWAFFTGTITKGGTEDLPALSEPFTENGLTVDLGGWGQAGRPIVTDDPRMTGTQSVRFHHFTDPSDGSSIIAVLSTIENDAGAWTCPLIALSVTGGSYSQAGWCEGVGGYAGLRAYFALGRDVPPSDVEVSGFITSADGLPFPEAPTN